MKKPEDNKRNHMVVSVNIATGEMRRWKSMAQAAKALDMCVITIYRAAQQVKPSCGYVWCNPGDEQRAEDLAEYMRKNGIDAPARGRPRKQNRMVWLQLDSHTRILVKPEEATPEFAIKYLKKLNKE